MRNKSAPDGETLKRTPAFQEGHGQSGRSVTSHTICSVEVEQFPTDPKIASGTKGSRRNRGNRDEEILV